RIAAGAPITVAQRLREIWAFGPPASGSAGCGLDRSPDHTQSLRSRGARLLPRLLRENTRAASLIIDASEKSPCGERTPPWHPEPFDFAQDRLREGSALIH